MTSSQVKTQWDEYLLKIDFMQKEKQEERD